MGRDFCFVVGVNIFLVSLVIIKPTGTETVVELVTLVPPEMADGQSHRRKTNNDETEVIISPPNCKKMILIMSKKQFRVFMACTKELQKIWTTKEEFSKHFQCVIKCALAKEKMLDENFLISNETIQQFFDRHIPPFFHEVGHIVVGGCAEEWGPKFPEPDQSCTAYGSFLKCIQEFVSDMCT